MHTSMNNLMWTRSSKHTKNGQFHYIMHRLAFMPDCTHTHIHTCNNPFSLFFLSLLIHTMNRDFVVHVFLLFFFLFDHALVFGTPFFLSVRVLSCALFQDHIVNADVAYPSTNSKYNKEVGLLKAGIAIG